MKDKEITVYELFGLIKDGKAPLKIKALDKVWNLENKNGVINYYSYVIGIPTLLNFNYLIENSRLKEPVEIIEKNDEWEDIEENNIGVAEFDLGGISSKSYIIKLMKNQNRIIKNQKYLKERLDEEWKQED